MISNATHRTLSKKKKKKSKRNESSLLQNWISTPAFADSYQSYRPFFCISVRVHSVVRSIPSLETLTPFCASDKDTPNLRGAWVGPSGCFFSWIRWSLVWIICCRTLAGKPLASGKPQGHDLFYRLEAGSWLAPCVCVCVCVWVCVCLLFFRHKMVNTTEMKCIWSNAVSLNWLKALEFENADFINELAFSKEKRTSTEELATDGGLGPAGCQQALERLVS